MNRPILIATSNAGKLVEFRRYLKEELECEGAGESVDVVEDGETYYENALKKALRYHERFNRPVLSDDSGLEVTALGGRPGVHSAGYGGDSISWAQRWQHLYTELKNVNANAPYEAAFVCVLCYYDGLHPPQFFKGKASGEISQRPSGEGGFGYDPIFRSALLGKTFAEADKQEKEKASHRGEALRHFLIWWKTTHPTA